MTNENKIIIAIAEKSEIIRTGLYYLIQNSNIAAEILYFNELSDLIEYHFPESSSTVLFINPNFVINQTKELKKLIKDHPKTHIIGLIHSYFPKEITNQFPNILNIEDDPIMLLKKLLFEEIEEDNKNTQESISEREMDVLLLLVNGFSNKEIADKLNISPHTVISHRKSITQKTGIKSQSGLTIYAITNKLISIES